MKRLNCINPIQYEILVYRFNHSLAHAVKESQCCKNAIASCVCRTVLSLKWYPVYEGCNDYYLCDHEQKCFQKIAEDCAQDLVALPTSVVVEIAIPLHKKARISKNFSY